MDLPDSTGTTPVDEGTPVHPSVSARGAGVRRRLVIDKPDYTEACRGLRQVLWLVLIAGTTSCTSVTPQPLHEPSFVDQLPQEPVVLEDDQGKAVAIYLVQGRSAPSLSGRRPRSAEALEVVRNFVGRESARLGLDSAGDLLDLIVERHNSPNQEPGALPESERRAEMAESLPTSRAETFGFAQTHAGVRVLGRSLNAVFVDDRLRMVSGTILPRSRIGKTLDALLEKPRLAYAESLRVATADCRQFDPEIQKTAGIAGQLHFDPESGRLLYLFYCDDQIRGVDGISGQLAFKETMGAQQWIPYPGGVDVRSVALGTPQSAANMAGHSWIPERTAVYQPGGIQVRSATLVDFRYVGAGLCDFSLSVNDLWHDRHSQRPFPSTFIPERSDNVPVTERGWCNQPNVVFDDITSVQFDAQIAHERLSTAARHALWQPGLRLLRWNGGSDDSAVKVQVHRAPADVLIHLFDPCNGAPGYYMWMEHRICLWSRDRRFNAWHTPLHEYGHYINHVYGWHHGLLPNSCDQHAAHEGMADAHVLNFEHFKYNPLGNLSETEITGLFITGPGDGMQRCHVSGAPCVAPQVNDINLFVDASNVACPGVSWPTVGEAYFKGMAIPQVMWKLLNNRVCVSSICTQGINIRRIAGWTGGTAPLSNRQVATAAREAFTLTMSTHPGSPAQALVTLKYLIFVLHGWRFSAAEWGRVSLAFSQNGVTFLSL